MTGDTDFSTGASCMAAWAGIASPIDKANASVDFSIIVISLAALDPDGRGSAPLARAASAAYFRITESQRALQLPLDLA